MSLVTPDFGLLVWMTLIFGIVLFVLAKFGFPVISASVEQRAERIRHALEQSREAERRMDSLAKEQEALISRTLEERDALLKDAAQTRQQIISQARADARTEADTIIGDARKDIEIEKENALREVRRQIADISMTIAEKVVKKSLGEDEAQQDYLQAMIEELDTASLTRPTEK